MVWDRKSLAHDAFTLFPERASINRLRRPAGSPAAIFALSLSNDNFSILFRNENHRLQISQKKQGFHSARC
jgi:hypothetical protein